MSSRDYTIDTLRAIGLIGIILAHVSPPLFIKVARTFDVPLMVIVSGLSYSGSSSSALTYGKYCQKRVLRLIAPTWLFLVVFFSFFYTIDLLTGNNTMTLSKILHSFLLTNKGGIGYVWIIRVFVIVAILAPIAKTIGVKLKENRLHYVFIIVVLLFYSYFAEISNSHYKYNFSSISSIFYNEYIIYSVPYLLLFLIGITVKEMGAAFLGQP